MYFIDFDIYMYIVKLNRELFPFNVNTHVRVVHFPASPPYLFHGNSDSLHMFS